MKLRIFLLTICLALCTAPGWTQTVQKADIAVGGGDYTQVTGNLFVSAVNTDSAAYDTVHIKVVGGDQTDAVHFWNVLTKNASNANDSVYVYLYGTAETGNGTNWQLLYTDISASFTGSYVFDHILTGNNYTNYYTVFRVLTDRKVDCHSEVLIR